jgi:hypothetical protein
LEASSTKRKPGTCTGAKNTNSDCCYFYPFCKSGSCGGQSGSKGCEFFNTGLIEIPENHVFLKKKREAKTKLDKINNTMARACFGNQHHCCKPDPGVLSLHFSLLVEFHCKEAEEISFPQPTRPPALALEFYSRILDKKGATSCQGFEGSWAAPPASLQCSPEELCGPKLCGPKVDCQLLPPVLPSL